MRYRVVEGRSQVETETRSNVHPIHASATRLSGWVEGEIGVDGMPDLEQPHKAHLEVPVDGLRTGNRLQDMEMQRRMNVRDYPAIEVTLLKAWKVEGEGRYRAAFEVSARGRSRAFEDDFKLGFDAGRLIVEGRHEFDMRDFGVDPPRFLSMKVEPQVAVRLRLEAEPDGDSQRQEPEMGRRGNG